MPPYGPTCHRRYLRFERLALGACRVLMWWRTRHRWVLYGNRAGPEPSTSVHIDLARKPAKWSRAHYTLGDRAISTTQNRCGLLNALGGLTLYRLLETLPQIFPRKGLPPVINLQVLLCGTTHCSSTGRKSSPINNTAPLNQVLVLY